MPKLPKVNRSETKAGDALETLWVAGNANHFHRGVESQFRNLNREHIQGIATRIRPSKPNRCRGYSTTEQAITFIEDDFKTGSAGACAGVREKEERERMVTSRHRQDNPDGGAAVPQRPGNARHQHLQIYSILFGSRLASIQNARRGSGSISLRRIVEAREIIGDHDNLAVGQTDELGPRRANGDRS